MKDRLYHRQYEIGEPAFYRRFRFAEDIDNRVPSACWAKLFLWVLGSNAFEDCFRQTCRPENVGSPFAYCGKCQHYFDKE